MSEEDPLYEGAVRVVCDCGWCGTQNELHSATYVFKGLYHPLYVCPKCGEADNTVHPRCEIDGCCEVGTAGTPTPNGYLVTCSKHIPSQGVKP